MSITNELYQIANESQSLDGHIARSLLDIINEVQKGHISPAVGKLQIRNFMHPFTTGKYQNKQKMTEIARDLVKSDLLSL
jgi:hypothetical protein